MGVHSSSHCWVRNTKLEASSVIAITIFSTCGLGTALEKVILVFILISAESVYFMLLSMVTKLFAFCDVLNKKRLMNSNTVKSVYFHITWLCLLAGMYVYAAELFQVIYNQISGIYNQIHSLIFTCQEGNQSQVKVC